MRVPLRTFVAAAFALFGGTSTLLAATRDGLPLIAGDLSIASEIAYGSAHLVTLGDSITKDIEPAYFRDWHPVQWSGVVLGPNLGGQYVLSNPSVASVGFHTVQQQRFGTSGPAGLAQVVPSMQAEFVFNGVSAPASDPAPQSLADRFYEVSLDPTALGPGAAWAYGATGTVNVTPIVYANSNGAASGTLAVTVRGNSLDTPLAVIPVTASASRPTVTGGTASVPAQVSNPGQALAADFRVTAGSAPPAGSNLIVNGVRFSSGGPGFQLASASQGGFWTDDFIDDQVTPADTLQQYVTLTDSNVALIALGANGLLVKDVATYKSDLQTIIDRYRGARPDMRFVLMTTYDLFNPSTSPDGVAAQQAYNQAMYELSATNTGVLFLNQYDATPDWSSLNASGYLADGRHPSATGVDYFASTQWDMISQAAASSVPEPSALAAAAVVVTFTPGWRRRRRQRRRHRI